MLFRKYSKDPVIRDKAATTIQKGTRRHLAEKHFAIRHLEAKDTTDYKVFLTGNDPNITELKDYRASRREGPIALIATAGYRSVSVACELAKESEVPPKIIIVDNSKHVVALWRATRQFVEQFFQPAAHKHSSGEDSRAHFLREFEKLMEKNKKYYRPDRSPGNDFYPSGDEIAYFKNLFAQYGYQRVKQVLRNVVVINQRWEDAATFKALKNIFNYLGIRNIYMYPTNIVSISHNNASPLASWDVEGQKRQNDILKNIQAMDPRLTIHTDCCLEHSMPETVYLTQDQNPERMKKILQTKWVGIRPSKLSVALMMIGLAAFIMHFCMPRGIMPEKVEKNLINLSSIANLFALFLLENKPHSAVDHLVHIDSSGRLFKSAEKTSKDEKAVTRGYRR